MPQLLSAQTDWLQFGFDARHSGVNPFEVEISQSGVGVHGVASLQALYHVPLPAIVNSAPIFLSQVATPLGVRDLLFMTALDGRLMARDAADGSEVWSQQPLAPPFDVSPWGYGTSSAPAIAPDRAFVYSYAFDGKIHKWQVGTGVESVGDGWPEVVTLKPQVEKASGALTIATTSDGHTYLYAVTSAFYGDAGDYQGHVTSIDLDTGAQTVFNVMCSDQNVHFADSAEPDCDMRGSGVWGRGGLVFDDATQRIYMTSGNGLYDANTGGHHFGDSVLALSAAGNGAAGLPLDSYTPTNYQDLQFADADLGALTVAILPPIAGSRFAHLGVQGGKDYKLRLLNLEDLSGQHGPAHVGGELSIVAISISETVTPQLVVWTDPTDGQVYIISSVNQCFRVDVDTDGNPSLTSIWPPIGSYWASSVIANDVGFFTDGRLIAFDPRTGEWLWSDMQYQGYGHWQSPIVVNGKIYYTDESGQSGMLSAYGLGADEIFAGDFEFL